MNANGSAFLSISPADLAAAGLARDPRSGVARMETADTPRLANVPREDALAVWAATGPLAEDEFGQLGLLSEDGSEMHVALAFPPVDSEPVRIEAGEGATTSATIRAPVTAPAGTRFTDLHLGTGDRAALLYADGAGRHGVLAVDLARRRQDRAELPGPARRLWVEGETVFAAGDTHLYRLEGEPLPQPYFPRPDRFEPVTIVPNPFRVVETSLLPGGWQLLSIAAFEGVPSLLVWRPEQERQAILRPDGSGGFVRADLPAVPFAVDHRHLGPREVVLMIPADPADTRFARCDLPAVALPDGDPGAGEARLLPRRYPQPSQARARFVGAGPPRIVTDRGPRGLWPLPQVRYRAGVTATPDPLDGGVPGTHWHRILMEACLPPGTNLSVAARAFDGAVPEGEFLPQPAPVWLPTGSEIPFEAGHFSPKEATEGLFEILLQRPDGPVRQLRGRHLELSLTLSSDGRRSPAIAAMRVYFPRNSWQEAYLPELFRQHAAPPEATGPASGADVRERLLAAFEGMLTPLEDRIAGAEGWLSPAAAPPAQLARLAAMLGTTLAPGPMERQRRHVALLGELQRTKGTMTGLALALDLATDGAVARSEVVPVEVYRLRRTMATLLGIELDDRDHPLTLGTGQSGNSIIGDTLILAEDDARTFLALFAPGLAEATGDAEEVEAFFDAHAHRLAVVVHEAAQPLRAAIEDALAENVPAGVVWDIVETDAPFVLGLSPLLGIDTLIETNPAWRRVVLDDTRLGREGILAGLAAFAPERVEDDAARRTISGGAP